MNTRKMLFAATAAAAALMSMTLAQATEAPQKKVSYADLDLEKHSDAAKLYDRLRLAAEDVCAHFTDASLNDRKLYLACINESLDAAVSEVNHDSVLALHDAKRRSVRLAGTQRSITSRT